jgi:DNA (cytosine-5)-methyltransferase 1
MGYHQAGFRVVGVDIKPQPRFPFEFIQADVRDIDPRWIAENFDAAHASPPCQFGTELNSDKSRHVNLIPATRAILDASGLPYVIENVRAVAAAGHLINPVSLFGTMFDCHMVTSAGQRFVLSRERAFETNWPLVAPNDPGAEGSPIANVFGGHLRSRSKAYRTGNGTGRTRDFIGEDKPALARQLMGMPWATMMGMSEAVPPAFTAAIGSQLLAHLQHRAAA